MSKNQDAQFDEALSILDPISLTVTAQGEVFNITNFKFLESLKVIKVLKENPNAIPFDLFDSSVELNSKELVNMIIQAIGGSGEVVAQILKLHLKKDDAWMEQLEFDEVLNLTLAVIKANVDFFTKTLLPMIPTSIKESF